MVVPVAIAGARVVAGAARTAARTGAKNAKRISQRPVVQSARVIHGYNRQRTAANDSTASTVDEQYATRYDTVAQQQAHIRQRVNERRQRKQAEKKSIRQEARQHFLRPDKAKRLAAKRVLNNQHLHQHARALRVTSLRFFFILALKAYGFFFVGWFIQIIGIMLTVGTAKTVDWIPIIGDNLVDGAILVGLLFFGAGWLITLCVLPTIHSAVIAIKKLPMEKGVLWLALSCLPLVQVASLGIWFVRGKDNKASS